MQHEMGDSNLLSFENRIAATAIVNQAALKCILRGVRVTPDNVVLMIGDFIDPQLPEHANLVKAILQAIDELDITPLSRQS